MAFIRLKVKEITPYDLLEFSESLVLNGDNYYVKRDAEKAAFYMDNHSIDSAKIVGPFIAEDVYIPVRGEEVFIKKDAKIRSTNPSQSTRIQGVTRKIKVHDVYYGHFIHEDLYQPCVVWAGRGGYWTYCNLGDFVQKVES